MLALTAVNFALYGPALFGPYLRIAGCVVIGVLGMLILIYPLFVLLLCRENPYRFLLKIRPPVIAAFLTRSSAAALPVSFRTSEELGIRKELSGFALPLGATINMDGACIHLPVFAILAANMFDVELTMGSLALLVVAVVFASIGAGGIPGGSVFLLFMVLSSLTKRRRQCLQLHRRAPERNDGSGASAARDGTRKLKHLQKKNGKKFAISG